MCAFRTPASRSASRFFWPGVFAAKACFNARGRTVAHLAGGKNLTIKVRSAATCGGNSVLHRLPAVSSGRTLHSSVTAGAAGLDALDPPVYAVIPRPGPSGPARPSRNILDEHASASCSCCRSIPCRDLRSRMGRFGSPFAGLTSAWVDPACGVRSARDPRDQFRELLDGVHARGAQLLLDLPDQPHRGASALQLHRPNGRPRFDGRVPFARRLGRGMGGPGGARLPPPGTARLHGGGLAFWCREGVDGFRCDADT